MPAPVIPLQKAELIGVFIEAIAYGAYLMIFIECIRVLRRKRNAGGDIKLLLGTTAIIFVLVTCHLCVDIDRNMDAFTTNTGTLNYAHTYYENYDTFKNLFKSGVYVAATVFADAFILYRCFIVWGRSYYIIAFPCLVFIADLGVGCLWTYTLSQVKDGEDVFKDNLGTRVQAFYAVTLSHNVICTTLISIRIWMIQRKVSRYANRDENSLAKVISIIVESGAVYSVLLAVLIGCMAAGTPAMFIFLNSISPFVGIVFSSVIIRVGSGTSHGDTVNPTRESQNGRRSTFRAAQGEQGVTISLSKVTHSDIPTYGVQSDKYLHSQSANDSLGEEV